MSNYHRFNKSFSAKRAVALVCLLCVAGVAAWAQPTRLYVDTSASTQVAPSKVYDGTTVATITVVGTPVGIVAPYTNVSLVAAANYTDPSVGGIKMVVVTYSLAGSDSALYLPPINDTLWASIMPKQLTISGTMIDSSKVYNHSTIANIQRVGTLQGVVAGDNVFPSATARYADANVGVAKPVVITYSLYGGNTMVYSNYILPATDTLTADITPLGLIAPAITLTPSKFYDGTVNCPVLDPGTITGIYSGDEVTYSASAVFLTPDAGENKVVTPVFTLNGPQSFNYTVVDTASTPYHADILPRQLGAQGAVVRTTKSYDGTTDAYVIYPAFPANYIDGETILISTTASFDSPEIGIGKTITLHYNLEENDYSSNYLAPEDEIYTTEGRIIAATVLDSSFGLNGIVSVGTHFCQDDYVELECHIAQGLPSNYTLVFNDAALAQGFSNRHDTIILGGESSFTMGFFIPESCAEGNYSVTIMIYNDAEDELVASWSFEVDMPNTYLVQVFNDVVSIDNTSERFNTFQWFKDGKAVSGATLPYYQDPDGYLNGLYSVRVNAGTDDEHMICPIEFDNTPAKSMKLYPNPVVNTTQVKIAGSDRETHELTLYNSYGTPVLKTTFSGSEYRLDMNSLPQGVYMLSVDDMNTKTVKL